MAAISKIIPHDILFTQEQIATRIDAMAHEIKTSGLQNFLIVSILKGSFMFAADLARALNKHDVNCSLDFIKTNSYFGGEVSNENLDILDMLECSITGKTILLVDDILDSGNTLHFVTQYLLEKGALDVKICVFLEKKIQRKYAIEPHFIGFKCPNRFVFGYGMDYEFGARCLPYVAAKEMPL